MQLYSKTYEALMNIFLTPILDLVLRLKNLIVFQVYIPQVLELIEISPVNSELQLAALRLLTNLSVTDKHQHLLKGSIKLLLSLLVVSNETLQVGRLYLFNEPFQALKACTFKGYW